MPSTRTVSVQQWPFRWGLSDLLALLWKMSLKSCRSDDGLNCDATQTPLVAVCSVALQSPTSQTERDL